MHTLSRQIRFSVSPFSEQVSGFNSYASKPTAEGLSFYVALWIDLVADLDPDTGFVINVSNIDHIVRSKTLWLFEKTIKDACDQGCSLSLSDMVRLLKRCWPVIQDSFNGPRLSQLRLELNPYRIIRFQPEDSEMMIYSEKFEFAAMHKLWNDKYNASENVAMFGKCANPTGHGHNYIIEVQVCCSTQSQPVGWVCDYQKVIKEELLDLVDHKNLNMDVPDFKSINPTVENLSIFAWQKLEEKFKNAKLHKVIVWENDRTYCSYSK